MKKVIAIVIAIVTLFSLSLTAQAKAAPKTTINTKNAKAGYVTVNLADEKAPACIKVVNTSRRQTANYSFTKTTKTRTVKIPLDLGKGNYSISVVQNYKNAATRTTTRTTVKYNPTTTTSSATLAWSAK